MNDLDDAAFFEAELIRGLGAVIIQRTATRCRLIFICKVEADFFVLHPSRNETPERLACEQEDNLKHVFVVLQKCIHHTINLGRIRHHAQG